MVTFFLSYFPHFNSKYIDTTSTKKKKKLFRKKENIKIIKQVCKKNMWIEEEGELEKKIKVVIIHTKLP